MSALFVRSLTGGILIAVILLLRVLLHERLPKETFRILWMIALCHLLLPKLPSSPLSIYSLGTGVIGALKAGAEEIGAGVAIQGLPVLPGQWSNGAMQSGEAKISLVFWIWLSGMLLCAAWFLIGYLRLIRKIRLAKPVPEEIAQKWSGECGCRYPIKLLQSSAVQVPLACGYFWPTILLPAHMDWSDRETLNCVLLHEKSHLQRGDLWLKAGMAIGACIYWFAPWVWLMLHTAEQDIELACDHAVLHRLGQDKRHSYAMALIRMEEQKSFRSTLASGFAGNALEARIIAIMKPAKITKAVLIAAVALCLCVTIGFAAAGETLEAQGEIVDPVKSEPGEKVDIGKQAIIKAASEEMPELEPEEEPLEAEPEVKPPYDSEAGSISEVWVWPVPSSNNITGRFGERTHPVTKEKMVYDHITIAAAKDILAAQSGKVLDVFFDSYSGNTIVIEHEDYVTMYGHLAEVTVRVDQHVEGGEVIGTAGRTGMATGDCLAFWVSRNGTMVDPMQFYKIEPKFISGSEIAED